MVLPSRVAGRTLGLRGPDLARGPEVARLCCRQSWRYIRVVCKEREGQFRGDGRTVRTLLFGVYKI